MMGSRKKLDVDRFIIAIKKSGLSIYDSIEMGDKRLWIPSPELEFLLNRELTGLLLDLPLRTRSKVIKQRICEALGYSVPNSFKKSQPRFPGQCFDTYVQKSNNLQIWNDELSATRRYVIIRVDDANAVTCVKVVTGEDLARLDTTGTLTQKYQARCLLKTEKAELITSSDTDVLSPFVKPTRKLDTKATPVSQPQSGEIFPIAEIFKRLKSIVGKKFLDAGNTQERNRGAKLHSIVCKSLGYSSYQDDGRFPDIRHQLLEIKLQTSPTIDLGLVRPNSTDPLDITKLGESTIRHCDVRYAVFFGDISSGEVRITHVILTTGEAFFSRFPQFQGKVLNKKFQIPLPSDFFVV